MGILLVPGMVEEVQAEFSDIDAAYTIVDDATGGSCNLIGTWDVSSKTCTLTGNVNAGTNHGITISSNNITLDGAGYTIMGDVRDENCMMRSTTDCGTKHWMMGNAGIWIPWGTSNVVITNVNINGFYNGILTRGADNITITGNTISSPGTYPHGGAIDLSAGYGATISDNTINNSYIGVFTYNVRGNNQCTGSSAYVIEDNTISGTNIGLKNDWNVVGNDDTVGVCIQDNTITGATEYGIEHYTSKGGVTKNNNISDSSGIGIKLRNSQLLTVTDNSVTNSNKGVVVDSNSSILTFSDNTVTGNTINFEGISQAGTVPEGTVTISETLNIYAYDSPGNPSPTGGDCTKIGTWETNDGVQAHMGLRCTLTADVQTLGHFAAIKIGQSIWQSGYVGDGTTEKIEIDGNGHTITGAGSSQMDASGVYLYKTHFPAVVNLQIDNFAVGINSYQTSGVTLTGNTINNPTNYGMYISGSGTCPDCDSGVHIGSNIINHSGGSAQSSIEVQGFEGTQSCASAISYFQDLSEIGQPPPGNNPSHVSITNNQINNSPNWGITLDTAGAGVCNNTITGAGSGMNISGPGYSNQQSNNNNISNNIVTSVGNGIVVVGSGNTIDSNTVTNANGKGFSFDFRSQNNVITNNIANNNGDYGFYFTLPGVDGFDTSIAPGSIGHTFTGNTATGNGIADIKGIQMGPVGPFTISSSGGDCSTIGTWNQGTKTCTLNTDLSYTINIYDSGITLDGNSHTLDTGETPTGSGSVSYTHLTLPTKA